MKNNGNISMGEYMRSLRKSRGLSLGDVEAKTDISRSYLCRIENESRDNLTMDIIYRLSRCYGIEFSAFERFCKGKDNIDGREVKDLAYILLNERYLFGKIENIEAKMILCEVIKEMENYCTKSEIRRQDGNRVMDLVDLLREELLSS